MSVVFAVLAIIGKFTIMTCQPANLPRASIMSREAVVNGLSDFSGAAQHQDVFGIIQINEFLKTINVYLFFL